MANQNINRAWAQIPMQDWLFDAWKKYAESVKNEQRVVLDIFIREYITVKKAYTDEQHVVFYAPNRKAKGRTVQIDADLYEQTEIFAKEYDTRINRVLMSALLEGLRSRRRIRI
ncbi:MAG: hypothetical protein ACI8XG_000341 [Congregibacter sp.]